MRLLELEGLDFPGKVLRNVVADLSRGHFFFYKLFLCRRAYNPFPLFRPFPSVPYTLHITLTKLGICPFDVHVIDFCWEFRRESIHPVLNVWQSKTIYSARPELERVNPCPHNLRF
jgi:hypothetical protein